MLKMHAELAIAVSANTEIAALKLQLQESETLRSKLQQMIATLSERIAVQSEMLARAAEYRGNAAGRVKELEEALAPFAAVLVNGWDTGTLPAGAVYPVLMGDLRQAARVLAGTQK